MARDREQMDLELPTVRGRQLRNLQQIRLGDALAKHLLRMIDDLIGTQRLYWDITIQELQDLTEMSRSTVYDRLRRLQDLDLVSVDDIERSYQKRFRICHSNIDAMVTDQRRKRNGWGQPVRETDDSVREADSVVRETDDSVRETDVRETDDSVRETDDSVRETDHTYTRLTRLTPPSLANAEGEGGNWQKIFSAICDAGVDHPTRAIDNARSRGASLDHIHEILAYWQRHREANGWGPEALRYRIDTAAPGLALDRGWPSKSPEAARREQQRKQAERRERESREFIAAKRAERNEFESQIDDLEQRYGSTLDALDDDELRDLATECQPRFWSVVQAKGRADQRTRAILLLQLSKQEQHEAAR